MVWFVFTMQSHHQETAAAAESSSSSSNQNTATESPAAALEGPSGSGWLRPHNQDPDWLRLGLATPDHHQASTSGRNIDDDRQQAHQDMAVVLDRRPMITGDGGGEGGGEGSSFIEVGLNIRQPGPGGGAGPSAPANFQLTSVIPSQFPVGASSTRHAPPRPLQLPSTPDFNAAAGFSFPLVFHQTATSTQQSQQTAQYWPFGPTVNPQQMQLIPSTAAGPSLGPPAPFGPFLMGLGPPLVQPPVAGPGSSTTSGSDVRFVVDPRPRRPHAGIWFRLLALQNQEPFLPQVAKSYLRIKDGRMTVGLLIKYLVNKLGLDNESQVEITCRGQPLAPSSTLQHVRDHIWRYSIITTDAQPLPRLRPDEIVTLLPDSSTDDHLMLLHYGRSPSSS
ncbi:hypothetical protein Droror1_Dr00018405 [Drosera rotundifolia]